MFEVFAAPLYKILRYFLPLILLMSGTSMEKLDYSAELKNGNDYEGLASVYEDYFPVGAAIYSQQLDDERLVNHIIKNFNHATPDYEFKQHSLNPSEGVWDFRGMDRLADFCRENNIMLRGHCLIWPVSETWMYYKDAEKTQLVDKDELYRRMDEYIGTVMLRYRDIVDSWDVVNEPCHYNRSSVYKEDTAVYKIAGDEFMEKSFEIATKYCDDDDRLFVNDTFVLGNKAKTENLFKTVEQLQKKGIKIDGVGIQGHMGTLSTTTFDVNFKALNKIADRCRKLGVKLEVTELDMKAYENETMREPTLPQWLEVWQINKYQCLFRELRDNKDVVTSVTFWGVDDAHNAIISGAKPGKDVEFPMLFDVNSMPKQSFYAVCDF